MLEIVQRCKGSESVRVHGEGVHTSKKMLKFKQWDILSPATVGDAFLIGQVLQPLDYLYGSPLDPLQSVRVYIKSASITNDCVRKVVGRSIQGKWVVLRRHGYVVSLQGLLSSYSSS